MKHACAILLVCLANLCLAQVPPTQTCASTAAPPSGYKHIVIFSFENRTWSNVGGVGFLDPAMPYMHSLATSCTYFSDWTETNTSQNSLTQYIGETSGVNNTSTVNDCTPNFPTSCFSTDNNIFRQVRLAGGTARNYVEGATSGCSASGNAAKHIPDLYYYGTYKDSSGVTHNDHDFCSTEVRPYSEFDVNNLPTYAFITPNLCNDGHDCGNSTVDSWASSNIQAVLNSASYQAGETAVFVWYDEDHPTPNTQMAPTAHAGDITQTGIGTHAALLKTIELMLGLPVMQQGQLITAADLRAITGLASTGGSTVSVSISPTSATVSSGGTQPFTATVTGSTDTGVTWSASAGTVTSTGTSTGLFTAPTVTATTTVTVKATSQADTTKSASAIVTITASTPAPTVTISASPTTITLGQSTTITWSSTSATSCTASGAWSGTKATSGSLSVTPTVTGTSTFTLACTGSGGTTTQSTSVTVNSTATASVLNYYVATTGSDSTGTGTQTNPWATITHAASALTLGSAGTVVHVAPGTYNGTVSISRSGTSSARITFMSDSKWGALIRATGVPQSPGYCFDVNASNDDIVGFDISGDCRTGLENDGGFNHIISNHVHNITSGGVCPTSGGSGIVDASYTLTDNWIIGNVVHDVASGVAGCNVVQGIYLSNPSGGLIYNNLVFKIEVYGIHLWHAASHATIANNVSCANGKSGLLIGGGDSGVTTGDDYTVAINNIFCNNAQYGAIEEGTIGTHNVLSNNIMYNNALGVTSGFSSSQVLNTITTNPLFVNYTGDFGGDYHLQSTSPGIDAGIASFSTAENLGLAPTDDFDETPRPQGAAWDIGAYEFIPTTSTVVVTISPTSATVVSGGTQQFTASVTGTSNTQVNWSASPGTVSSGLYTAPTVSVNTTATVKAISAADPTKSASATVTVTPQAPPSTTAPIVSLSPTSLTFPGQLVGTTSAAQLVTLTNTGNAALNFSGNFTISGDFSFAGLGTCGSSVAAGASCTISVNFTPTAAGTRTGTVTIGDNAAGSPQTIPLSGTGLTSDVVSISPTSATVVSGGTQQFSATVTGSTDPSVTWSATAGGISSGLFTAPTVSANTTVTVKATSVADPTKSASATVTVTPQPPPSTTAPIVSLSPTSLTFSGQLVGTTSAAQLVTLTNTGNAALNFSGNFTISGDFSFAGLGTCGSSVAAGASCTISVNFTPTAAGTRTGTVTIGDNAAGSPQTIPLSGTGLNPATSPDFSLSVTPLSQTVARGLATQPYKITVASLGGFTGSVTFAVSGLPGNASASFSPASVQGSGSSNMTITTGKGRTGTFTLTISASSGIITHTTSVSLNITR